ncbi:bifunctional hydroxymethylpyrimidine kinase/phosphomethylpyrimidine kinase [Gulosibacter chungangensis]|uniref:Bifunctional hydroxymethylpyrimidine kinase/phosphomethylpyrimidine kinase n=1 Tax=Gulosibacter chungangensis TaxID=979746 RepID=A0A7J5BDG5_9MICO|nr:bifunctional hydroxymethylpyrimidine kinase/phosphomethylpyrimidine kinase [Gulosibacter chungangensis]KAB1643916.1 bifunctional hydroxymethylpyrimidine kinase/phosphomethylpyrimidine kinase [Gulosibacter chungangensis]
MTGVAPEVLSIAGSDPSGGAGIQADLKTFSALGAYGMTIITALTAQSTRGVTAIHPVPVSFVREQFDTLLEDIQPKAAKIGMLGSAELTRVVSEYASKVPNLILDPVMVATSGDRLLEESAIVAVRDLCTRVDLITPNRYETAVLLDTNPARCLDELIDQALELFEHGVSRVLAKGGHMETADGRATDVFVDDLGDVTLLSSPRVNTRNTHGTGCTLSSAIAALSPRAGDWLTTIRKAKAYLGEALAAADALEIGHGSGPVDHFVRWRSTADSTVAKGLQQGPLKPGELRVDERVEISWPR